MVLFCPYDHACKRCCHFRFDDEHGDMACFLKQDTKEKEEDLDD